MVNPASTAHAREGSVNLRANRSRPFREWKLARHGGRKRPIEIYPNQVFHSREEAEWAVLKLRWQELTGEELN